MQAQHHGITVATEQSSSHPFVAITLTGMLAQADHEVLAQQLKHVSQDYPNKTINVLIDATELQGWQPAVESEGWSLMLEYSEKFNKVAIYGNKDWQDEFSTLMKWLSNASFKFFRDRDAALQWLSS